VDAIIAFFREFWRQTMSVLSDLGQWFISVVDPNAGPWPKITVGGIFLLVVLIIVSKTSRPR
jgi:hypothetical protein